MLIFCHLNTCIFYDLPHFKIIYTSKAMQHGNSKCNDGKTISGEMSIIEAVVIIIYCKLIMKEKLKISKISCCDN